MITIYMMHAHPKKLHSSLPAHARDASGALEGLAFIEPLSVRTGITFMCADLAILHAPRRG